MAENALICPGCARAHLPSERFCEACGMPLVRPGAREPPASARRRRARKIKPQYAEGDLVRVAGGRNQAEAEFIQGMLLEEGVPSLLRRSRGFDVPDYLAAGPRDVMVPASGVSTARQVLLEAEMLPSGAPGEGVPPLRLLAGLLAAAALVAIIAWLGTDLLG
jgi:hypothetical protein